MAAEMLDAATERNIATMDDELFFDVFAKSVKPHRTKRSKR